MADEQRSFFDEPKPKPALVHRVPRKPGTVTFANPDAERIIRLLAPLAREMAAMAGHHGVTMGEVKEEAIKRGRITGNEGKVLSCLAQLPECCDPRLVATEIRRYNASGNPNVVFCHPDYAPKDSAA